MSVHASGTPKPALSNLPFPELIPLSVALPIMEIAVWCVWAVYTNTETLEAAVPTNIYPEVVAGGSEPPEVAMLASALQCILSQQCHGRRSCC